MDRLNGTVNVNLSVAKVNYLNELIERDKAKPMVENQITENGRIYLECPVCRCFNTSYNFCPNCGQRLDKENVEL